MFINEIRAAGRLTADVELRATNSGISYASFNLAVERPKVEGKETETDFLEVKCWRGKAEWLANNIGKGTPLYVDGSLRIDRWTDQQGQKRERVYIDADDIKVVSYSDVKRPANYVDPAMRQNGQQPIPQGYAPAQNGYQPQGGYQQNTYQQPVPQGYAQPAQNGYQPQGYAPAPAQNQYAQPQAQGQYQQQPNAAQYAPAPQQPVQNGYQQNQYQQPAPQQPQAPGPGYNPGNEFTPILDDDLPF